MDIILNNTLSRKQKIHQNIFYCTLILIAITLPFSLLANSISIVLLFANWLAEGNYVSRIKTVNYKFALMFFMLFYALHATGMLYTANTENGLFELQKKLSLLILPLAIATSWRLTRLQIKNIFIAFTLATLLASFICLGYAFYRSGIIHTFPEVNWLYFSYRDLTSVINIQPTYLALYVSFALLILLCFFINDYQRLQTRKKIFLFMLLTYLFVFLLLLASRIAIASVLALSFLGTIYYSYKVKKLLKGIAILGSMVFFAFFLLFQIPVIKERFMQTIGVEQKNVWINQYGDGQGAISDMRSLKWKCSWNIIKENLITGVGTGDVQDALQIQYKNTNFDTAFQSRFNAHNQFLETWMGLGLPGILSLVLCLGIPLVMAFWQERYIYLSFILLNIFLFLTESALCRQNGIVFFSLFLSLLTFHPFPAVQKENNQEISH